MKSENSICVKSRMSTAAVGIFVAVVAYFSNGAFSIGRMRAKNKSELPDEWTPYIKAGIYVIVGILVVRVILAIIHNRKISEGG